MQTRSRVSFSPHNATKNIPVTQNNSCSKDYPTKRTKQKRSEIYVEKSLDTCPCNLLESIKLHHNSKEQDWIQCDSCNQYYHRECIVINRKVYKQDFKNDPNYIYNCLPCRFKFEYEDLINKYKEDIDKLFLQDTIESHFSDSVHNHINTYSDRFSKSLTNITAVEAVQVNQEVRDIGSLQESSIVSSHPISPTHSIASSTIPLPIPFNFAPETPQIDTQSSPFNFSPETPQIETQSSPNPTLTPQKHTDPELYNPENVVILDGIDNPSQFSHSSEILREIKAIKPKLSCKFAHILHGGGIAIYCNTQSDKEEALKPWPNSAFNSKRLYPHSPKGRPTISKVVVRNIPQKVSDLDIAKSVKQHTGLDCEVHRFTNKRTNKCMPIASLKFSNLTSEIHTSIIAKGIQIGDYILKCEPFRNFKVYRCYNCQSYGHVAKSCKKLGRCPSCGEHSDHSSNHICNGKKFCTNCNCSTHTSDSKFCPQYRKLFTSITSRSPSLYHENFATKHSVSQHITDTSEWLCRQ